MICPTIHAECKNFGTTVELLRASNHGLIPEAQYTEEIAVERMAGHCATMNAEISGIWPSSVESTGCPVVDAALLEVS